MNAFYNLNFMVFHAAHMVICDMKLAWLNAQLAILRSQKAALEAKLKFAEEMNAKHHLSE